MAEIIEKELNTSDMNKLLKLMSLCKCSINLTINQHRDYYETAEQSIKEAEESMCPPEIDDSIRQKMIKTDTIITLQFYPYTPIGSYDLWHYDLNKILDEAIEQLSSDRSS